MSQQKFSFVDDSQSRLLSPLKGKQRRKKGHQTTTKKPSFDTSIDSDISGTGSLTYSSSSQAGESTDSEIDCYERVNMNRKVSNTADSLNYSEDDEASLHRQQMRDTTGQSSNSYGHDGGSGIEPKLTTPPMTHDKSSRRRVSSKSSRKHASPTMGLVASDVSLSSTGTNTPSSPPPRYHKRMSADHATEVEYSKWWMCGFTDALNFNSNY